MKIMKRALAAGVSLSLILGQVMPAQSLMMETDEPPPTAPDPGYIPPPPSPPVPNGGLGLSNSHSCVYSPIWQLEAMQGQGYQNYPLGFNGPNLGARYTRTTNNWGPVKDLGTVATAGAWAIRLFLANYFLDRLIDDVWETRSDDLWVPGGNNHLQGFVLYNGNPGTWQSSNTYAFVTGSDWRGAVQDGTGGDLFWVKFPSRPNGYSLPLAHASRGARSNMFSLNGELRANASDYVFRHTLLNQPGYHDATPVGAPSAGPAWHAGGPQFYNGVIAVPLEYSDPQGENEAKSSRIEFYDVGSSPENPMLIWGATIYLGAKAGAVALTRNADGYWYVGVWDDARLKVYKSNGTNLSSGWATAYPFREARVGEDYPTTNVSRFPGVGSIDGNAGHYQSIQFVNDCNGDYYLVGLNNNYQGFGTDFADVYKWEYSSAAMEWQFRKVAWVQFNGNSHFNDASGLYIDANKKLRIYTAQGFRSSNNHPTFTFREFAAP